MREPPRLADAAIRTALQARYGIPVSALAFLPLGADSASYAFRVSAADGATYFLKVRTREGFSMPSLVVPRYFYDQGVPHIVAPLPTVTQTPSVSLDDFVLSLYPFIDGQVGADAGLSEEHWRAFGAMVRQIHASRLTPELKQIVPREPYTPTRRNVMPELETAIAGQAIADPAQRELAAFWQSRRDEIGALVARADALGRELRRASAPPVVCHADLHTWNVLLDQERQMWLVDWDETILAPKERDLMFVVGGIGRDLVRPRDTACFFQGYGDAEIDLPALTYYRYAWAVQDMAAYGERVFFLPDLTVESRRDAVDGFVDMFEPGNIVDLAFQSSSRTGADAIYS